MCLSTPTLYILSVFKYSVVGTRFHSNEVVFRLYQKERNGYVSCLHLVIYELLPIYVTLIPHFKD